MHKGKRYADGAKSVNADQLYAPIEAIELIKSMPQAKFDETVEAHFRLGVDPKHADQLVRGTVVLPKGTGKVPTVIVFAEGEKAKEAEEAGADVVGTADLVERISKGWLDFDVAISTPDMMKNVGRLGKILGTRGLMPNPKTGTVTFDVGKAVSDAKSGKVEYRTDKFGIIHSVIGKKSFPAGDLIENYTTLLDEIIRAKPAAAKGRYLKSVSFSTSMSSGVKVDTSKGREAVAEGV